MDQFSSQSSASLRDAINAIVDDRNRKAQQFAQKREGYQNLAKTVDQIVSSINSLNTNTPEVRKLLGEGFLNATKEISGSDVASFRKKYSELDALIQDVYERYRKTEINISVVGMARQGKSTLLQSISGLDGTVIPAFDSADCTGAVSVIRNVDSAETTAKVYFQSIAQMINIVNNYITAICGNQYPLIQGFYDIPNVDLERINVIAGNKEPQKFEQLKSYVSKFSEWSKLVEEYEGGDRYLYLTDPKKIIEYVSQHNGQGTRYYNYLAVKKVEISCCFNYRDAGKIVLRDTIGLGDDKMIGLDNAVIDAITDGCDAAVIVNNADATKTLREEDMKLYRKLHSSCIKRGLDMNKWFFFFINHTKALSNNANDYNRIDNGDFCKALAEHISDRNIDNAGVCIADASDKDEVTNNLVVPMLRVLRKNLPELDKSLETQIENKITEVKVEFDKILQACNKAKIYLNVDNIAAMITGFDGQAIYSKADEQFKNLVEDYHQKIGVNCKEFESILGALTPNNKESSSILPTVEDVILALKMGGQAGMPANVFTLFLTKMKNDFTKIFVQMDEFLNVLVIDLQKSVIDILGKTMRFDKLVGSDAFDEIHKKLAEEYLALQNSRGNTSITMQDALDETADDVYAAWIIEARNQLEFHGNFKGAEYNEIYIALEFMASLNLSARNFLLHRIRSCMDILDPYIDIAFRAPTFQGTTREEIAVSILRALNGRFTRAQTDSLTKIRSLLSEPNIILFSAVSEFRDRLLYSCTRLENEGQIMLIPTENVWRNQIYSPAGKGHEIFNREAFEALKMARALQEKFIEIANFKNI